MLAKRPGFSILAILTLAIGIGLTTQMYTVVDALFFRGLPYENEDRLVNLSSWNRAQNFQMGGISVHDLDYFRERQTSFEAFTTYGTGTINLSQEGNPERVDGAFVEDNLFALLGIEPYMGRLFQPGESDPGAQRVAVIAHSIWQRRFASDPDILNQTIRVNGEVVPIVGVLPPNTHWPNREEIYTNRTVDVAGTQRERWGNRPGTIGLLRAGVTLDEATTQLIGFAGILEEEFPDSNEGVTVQVEPLINNFQDDGSRSAVSSMFFSTIFVLIIACANVANLLLARSTLRQKEMAIRSALGANRWAIMRQILLESTLLSSIGAVFGIIYALVGLKLLENAVAMMNLPPWMEISFNSKVLPFIILITLVSGVLAGLLPALYSSKTDVNEILKDDTRTGTGRLTGLASKFLVVFQIALTCIVLICTGLTIRTIMNIQNVDLGFNPDNILTARIGLFEGDYPDQEAQMIFMDRLTETMRNQPGVESVTTFTRYPGRGGWFGPEFRYVLQEGAKFTSEQDLPVVRMNVIGENFFNVFQSQVLTGRDFNEGDVLPENYFAPETFRPALINTGMAEQLWPGEDPIGKRFSMPDGTSQGQSASFFFTIVGTVSDMNMNGINDNQSPGNGFYLPIRQQPPRFFTIAVRTRQDPMQMAPTLRQEISRLDPNLPIYWVESMNDRLEEVIFGQLITRNLFTLFGICALILACIGLYGVMSYSVNQRTQEIGIRMAIGANGNRVLRMVIWQGSRQVILGLILGLIGAFFATNFLATLLYDVNPRDPITFGAVVLILVAVALLSIFVPARRASRVDPAKALHTQ